jgi:hypothetical protein
MQRWEYCHLNQFSKPYNIKYYRATRGADIVEVKRDKTKGDRSDEDACNRILAELGLQGWEAVGHLGQAATILFKRPLEP